LRSKNKPALFLACLLFLAFGRAGKKIGRHCQGRAGIKINE